MAPSSCIVRLALKMVNLWPKYLMIFESAQAFLKYFTVFKNIYKW